MKPEEIERKTEALKILKHYNRMHNDLEAYLYHVAEWGLGLCPRPNPKHFGVED